MTTPAPPSTTPQIRIEELSNLAEVGRGAAATVYRCTRPDGSPVAVKIFNAVAPDDAAADQYRREEQALRRLPRHPAVVALEARGRTGDGRPFLVLELTERSLATMVAENGPMPWEDAIAMAVTVAGALETAHRCGVVHCDVSSANIHRVDGRWKLADFGASCAEPGGTDEAARPFTLDHAAPEAIRGEPGAAGRDVYGLASTLFHALAGEPPFGEVRQHPADDIARRIATEPAPDLRAGGVPDAICQVIERALSKDPELRPPSAGALAEELTAAAEPLGVSLTPPLVLAPIAAGLTIVPADLHSGASGPVIEAPPSPKRTGGRFAPMLVGMAAAALALGAAVPVITDAIDEGPTSLVLGDQPAEVALAAAEPDGAAEVDDAGDGGDAGGTDETAAADAAATPVPADGGPDGPAAAGAGGGAPQPVATAGNDGGRGNDGPGNGGGADNAPTAAPAGNDTGGGGGNGGGDGGNGNGGGNGNRGGNNGPGGPPAN